MGFSKNEIMNEIWEDVNVWHAKADVYIFFCVIIPK